MIVISLSFIICHLSFCTLGAQTYTQRLQKKTAGQGTVTIHHSKAIDDLVNGPNVNTAPAAPKKVEQMQAPAATTTHKTETVKDNTKTVHPQQEIVSLQATDTTSTAKKVNKKMVMVYRVQAYAGGNSRKDRRTAEQIGNQLRTLFPQESVYVHFYTPRWICRMGNYRTYEEAHHVLQEVKKMGYNAATIVKGKTAVAY